MDISGLTVFYNLTTGSMLNIVPEITYPGLVIQLIGTVVGGIGNTLIILAVVLRRSLHQLNNYFVVNLAIADLLMTLIVDPFGIVSIFHGQIYYMERPALCIFVASVCLTACYCSLLSLGAIAINRYIHICHHARYSSVFTRRSTIVMCVTLWIVSFLLEMPNFLGWGGHAYDWKNILCLWDRLASRSYTIFFGFVAVAMPCCITAICYLLIFLRIRQTTKNVKKLLAEQPQQQQAQQQQQAFSSARLAKTLFLVFAVLVFCWTPFTVLVVFDHDNHLPMHFHAYSTFLAHSNSTVNFLVYGLSNREFLKGYQDALRRLGAACHLGGRGNRVGNQGSFAMQEAR